MNQQYTTSPTLSELSLKYWKRYKRIAPELTVRVTTEWPIMTSLQPCWCPGGHICLGMYLYLIITPMLFSFYILFSGTSTFGFFIYLCFILCALQWTFRVYRYFIITRLVTKRCSFHHGAKAPHQRRDLFSSLPLWSSLPKTFSKFAPFVAWSRFLQGKFSSFCAKAETENEKFNVDWHVKPSVSWISWVNHWFCSTRWS